ncbi:hypothetical protein [Moraxella oblonga]|uniref:hypothetical protein n=1 Tax=Moraxella oblonga TaxID=200413 RepID=UPI000834B198|nr:hypothetical protein [Moraxella oblonga]
MSYYTMVAFTWDDREYQAKHNQPFSFELVKPIAEEWAIEYDCSVEGVLEDLEIMMKGTWSTGFNGLYAGLILNLFDTISEKFPDVRFIVRGMGEEYTDLWLRELLAGKCLFGVGPFERDEESGWRE